MSVSGFACINQYTELVALDKVLVSQNEQGTVVLRHRMAGHVNITPRDYKDEMLRERNTLNIYTVGTQN